MTSVSQRPGVPGGLHQVCERVMGEYLPLAKVFGLRLELAFPAGQSSASVLCCAEELAVPQDRPPLPM